MASTLEKYTLRGNNLRTGLKSWDVTGASAIFEQGATRKARLTATRAVMLGVFALAVKKDTSQVYVTVDLANGEQVIIEAPVKREKQAREFAQAINKAAQ
jgi:hypothetical protein